MFRSALVRGKDEEEFDRCCRNILIGSLGVRGGGKFANGAVTAAVALLVGEGIKKFGEMRQRETSRRKLTEAMNQKAPATAEEFFATMNEKEWSYRRGLGTHNMGGARGNVDFRYIGSAPEYKGWQLIYGTDHTLVDNLLNGGTYDFVTPQVGNALSVGNHFMVDAVPWVAVGNGAGDSSWLGSRIWALTKPGYSMSAEEVKSQFWIQ